MRWGFELSSFSAYAWSEVVMCRRKQEMHVTFHRRRDPVGEGRMDITPIPTDDPEKDRTVQRSTRYGCSFDNDVYADVPEVQSVFGH